LNGRSTGAVYGQRDAGNSLLESLLQQRFQPLATETGLHAATRRNDPLKPHDVDDMRFDAKARGDDPEEFFEHCFI
jgi:hypothetical protein